MPACRLGKNDILLADLVLTLDESSAARLVLFWLPVSGLEAQQWDQQLLLQMKDWLSVRVWQASGWAVILARVLHQQKHVNMCYLATKLGQSHQICALQYLAPFER